jgi:hypothetical protein
MGYCCGVDWGGSVQAVCVIDDADGHVVARFTIDHTAEGLAELRRRLDKIAPAATIPIAIERPSGLIVEALIQAGHPVVPIHPNVVKACRLRYRAAGGKSDPGDAYLLADVLRTDGHRFRRLTPCSDAVKALRALVRTRDDLVADRVALANRLRSLLEGFWPGASSPTSPRRSRWHSCNAIQPLTAPCAWAKSAWRSSSPGTAIAAAAPQPNCLPACTRLRKAIREMLKPRRVANLSVPSPPSWPAWWPRSSS